MRRRVNLKIVIPAIVVGLVILFAAVGVLSVDRSGRVANLAISSDMDGELSGAGKSISSEVRVQDEAVSEGASGNAGVDAAVPPAGPTQNRYLVRNGNLSLLIERGTLLDTVSRIGDMTAEMDGYIMSSSVGGSPDGYPSGPPQPFSDEEMAQMSAPESSAMVAPDQAWMTLRVPEASFEAAMRRFAKLGEVRSITSSSDDVTAQHVDLQAQLRHHRAVEKRLLRFLAATKTIREMLSVQDRIDAVQLTIEELEAQFKALREMTSYGTLSISLLEKDAPQTGQIDPSDSFGGVFWKSLTTLGRGAHLTALALTAALPFLVVLGGLGLAGWYAVRRLRRRRPTQPTLPA